MSEPELRDMFGGPEYIGPVKGVKTEYQVFRTGRGDFIVFSRSNRSATSFHMTFVAASRVEALRGAIPPKGATSKSLLKEKAVVQAFSTEGAGVQYFDVLTALYVMAALGGVEVTKSGRNLVFTPTGP